MHDRSAIMQAAWKHYRHLTAYRTSFDCKLFADVLRYIWAETKRRIRHAAEAEARRVAEIEAFKAAPLPTVAPKSELEERIDGLKYLSFRYDIGRMEREMRAEHARSMGAA